MKCSVFIWVFTVSKITHLGVSRIQRINKEKTIAINCDWDYNQACITRGGSRISGKGVRMYKGMGVRFAVDQVISGRYRGGSG